MGADNKNNDNQPVDISTADEDKRIKKILLIDTITKECKSSDNKILQRINIAINKGSKLEATILSGGYTNYSYKVYISDQPDELCIYAKLCFEHALVSYNLLYCAYDMFNIFILIIRPLLIPILLSLIVES